MKRNVRNRAQRRAGRRQLHPVARGLAAFTLIGLVAVAAGCRRTVPRGDKTAPPKPGPSANRNPGVEALGTEGGQVTLSDRKGEWRWRVFAKTIEAHGDVARLAPAKFEFSRRQTIELTGQAGRADLHFDTEVVVLQGRVALEAPANRTSLKADRVEWRAKNGGLVATGNVAYRRGTAAITASRLASDSGLTKVTFSDDSR